MPPSKKTWPWTASTRKRVATVPPPSECTSEGNDTPAQRQPSLASSGKSRPGAHSTPIEPYRHIVSPGQSSSENDESLVSTAEEPPIPAKGPSQARAKIRRRIVTTTSEETEHSPDREPQARKKRTTKKPSEDADDTPVVNLPVRGRRRQKPVEDADDTPVVNPPVRGRRRLVRRRRPWVWQLRQNWRTEWPWVNGRDPLDAEILTEIKSPRRPHDQSRYEIPVRPKQPSSADLLFDAYLAECKAFEPPPPTPSPPATPTPPPTPESRTRSDEELHDSSPELTRSMCPWMLPLDFDINAPPSPQQGDSD